MKPTDYKTVLKTLDRWSCEARAASKETPDLDGKLHMVRLQKALEGARSKLRVMYYEAEDLEKHQATCKESLQVQHECPRCRETCKCEASTLLVKGACSHDCHVPVGGCIAR